MSNFEATSGLIAYDNAAEAGDEFKSDVLALATMILERESGADNAGGNLTKRISQRLAELQAKYTEKGPHDVGGEVQRVAAWLYESEHRLPKNFQRNDFGQVITRTKSDKGSTDTLIAEDIYAVAAFETYEDRHDGVLFNFKHRSGERRELSVKSEDLYGSKEACVRNVAKHGWLVEDGQEDEARALLRGVRPRRTITMFERTTGHLQHKGQRLFIAKDRVHVSGDLDPDSFKFGGEDAAVPRTDTCGEFEKWIEGACRFGVGNTRLTFCANAAFAGPLLVTMGQAGANLNLLGESSRGKTTAQQFGGSVWGNGKNTGWLRSVAQSSGGWS